jgi:hypothetical protein
LVQLLGLQGALMISRFMVCSVESTS